MLTEMKIESDYKGVLATITKPKETSCHLDTNKQTCGHAGTL